MLDESYHIYGEDGDWCVRASRAGYKLVYVPSTAIWDKLSVSTGGAPFVTQELEQVKESGSSHGALCEAIPLGDDAVLVHQ